jgi:serum/glucocorticoid-regulated kinase 2
MYEKILTSDLRFPRHFAPEARSLLAGMLTRRVDDRLGYSGAAELKAHPFFAGLNWDTVAARGYKPIFVPPANGIDGVAAAEGDAAPANGAAGGGAGGRAAAVTAVVSNFEEEFTKELPVDSVDERSKLSSTAVERTHFEGFTYMGDGGVLGAAAERYGRASRGDSFNEQFGAGSPPSGASALPRQSPAASRSPAPSRTTSGRGEFKASQ